MLLEAIGCEMAHPGDWGDQVRELSDGETETIAPLEHQRYKEWMEARQWTYAPAPKNAERKTNPSLVPWADLDEHSRVFTRSQIELLPAALAQAGYVIVPKQRLPG